MGLVSEQAPPPPTVEKPIKVPEQPMRAWRNELLSRPQMQDLEETVNTPGYEVIKDLWANTMEGFITYMIELPPSKSDDILAYHKVVHGLYLGIKSVNAQVSGYVQLLQAEREEASALQKALEFKYGADPLENTEVLNKLLNPIYQAQPPEPRPPRAQRPVAETPLDKMMRARETSEGSKTS